MPIKLNKNNSKDGYLKFDLLENDICFSTYIYYINKFK